MAKLTMQDNSVKYVDYNTAAKVWQILEGNDESITDLKELEELKTLATEVIKIDFKALEK